MYRYCDATAMRPLRDCRATLSTRCSCITTALGRYIRKHGRVACTHSRRSFGLRVRRYRRLRRSRRRHCTSIIVYYIVIFYRLSLLTDTSVSISVVVTGVCLYNYYTTTTTSKRDQHSASHHGVVGQEVTTLIIDVTK